MEKNNIDFCVAFWGIRGSHTTDHNTNKYGTNTSCVEIRAGDKSMIFDAGSGIIGLGKMLADKKRIEDIHIFLSHYHMDHIYGLLHFSPIYMKSSNITLYGGQYNMQCPEEIIKSVFAPPFHPVALNNISCDLQFRTVLEGHTIEYNENIEIEVINLPHPGGSLGYKISYNNKSCCYITDIEIGALKDKQILIDFIHQTDMLIMDSMYTKQELTNTPSKKGWGHSSWNEVVELARESEIKNLFLFHVSPHKKDEELDEILVEARKRFKNTYIAKEGSVFEF